MSIWDDDPTRDAVLIAGRKSGLSFGQIARRLGITRNAAQGRAFRLGLCGSRPTGPRIRRAARPEPILEPTLEPEPAPMPEMKPVAVSNPTRLIDTKPNQCRWLLDGYAEPTVCGADGFPWCPDHYARCYAQSPKRRVA